MIYKIIYKHNRKLASNEILKSDDILNMINFPVSCKNKKDIGENLIMEMEFILFNDIKDKCPDKYLHRLNNDSFNNETS